MTPAARLILMRRQNVALLLGFEGADGSTTFTDESKFRHAIVVTNNTQIDTAQFKFGASSALFDGTNDRLSISDGSMWPKGRERFTLELWVRPTSLTSSRMFLGQWGTAFTNGWVFYHNATGGLSFAWHDGTTQYGVNDGVATLSVDTWAHVAVDRDTGGVIRLYKDGTMVGKDTANAATSIFDTSHAFFIGADSDQAWDYVGHMDEIRVTTKKSVYGDVYGDAGFTAPTTAFPR